MSAWILIILTFSGEDHRPVEIPMNSQQRCEMAKLLIEAEWKKTEFRPPYQQRALCVLR